MAEVAARLFQNGLQLIEEFDNPMPRWWLWTFYATIFWGLIYTIMPKSCTLFSGRQVPTLRIIPRKTETHGRDCQ